MAANPGLIQNDHYFTQVGQLQAMTTTDFGDRTAASSVTTIQCLIYQEKEEESQTLPAVGKLIDHFACIPSSVSVSRGDQLQSVVDVNGSTVLTAARVVKVTEYNHWRYGSRFVKLDLDLDLV
jgi:hypothetical protein